MIGATDRANELLEIANNSSGVALETQKIWAESLDAKFKELNNSVTLFWQTLLDSGSISSVVEGLTAMVNAVTKFVDTFGAFPSVVFAATSSYTIFNKEMRQGISTITSGLIPSYGALIDKINKKTSALKTAIEKDREVVAHLRAEIESHKELGLSTVSLTHNLNKKTAVLEKNTKALIVNQLKTVALQSALSFGLSAAISLGISLLTKFISGLKSTEEQVDNTISSLKELSSAFESADLFESKLSALEEMTEQLEKVVEGSEEQQDLLQKIESIKEDIANYDDQSYMIIKNTNLTLEEQLALLKQINKEKVQEAVDKFEKENDQKTVTGLKNTLNYDANHWKAQEEALAEALKQGLDEVTFRGKKYGLTEFQKEHEEVAERIKSNYAKLTGISATLDDLKKQGGNVSLVVYDVTEQTAQIAKELLGIKDATEEVVEETDKYNRLVKRTPEQVRESVNSYVDACEQLENARELLETINKEGMNVENAQSLLGMFEDYTGNITNTAEVQEFLNNKIKEMADSQAEAYDQMMRMDADYWNQKYKDSDDWVNYVNSLENEVINITSKSLGVQNQEFIDFINSKGGFREIDLSNAGNLLEAQEIAESETIKQLASFWKQFYTEKIAMLDADTQSLMDTYGSNLSKMPEEVQKQVRQNLLMGNKYKKDLYNAIKGLDNLKFDTKPYIPNSNQNQIGKRPSSSSSSSSGSGSSSSSEVADLELTINRYHDLEDALNDVEKALKKNQVLQKTATPTEKVKLMKEEIELYKQQQKLLKEIWDEQKKETAEIKQELMKQGFIFDQFGNIQNYTSQLIAFEKKANALSGTQKEATIEAVEAVVDLIEQYEKLTNETLPNSESSYLEMMDTIKQAEKERLEYITEVQNKISEAIQSELEKRTEAIKKQIEKERDLYNSTYDEETYESDLRRENRKLDELKQQIANISRDTSLAGQLKLQQLMDEYEAQQEIINNMIRENEHQKGDQAFQDALDKADEKLEEMLDPKSLANLVNQALTTGFVTLNGEIVEVSNLLVQMLEDSGDLFTAVGETLKSELIDSLIVAKELMTDISSLTMTRSVDLGVGTAGYDLTTSALQSRSLNLASGNIGAASVSLTFENLLNIEGNLDHTILGEVQVMLDEAQNQIIHKVSRALTTK